MAYNILVVDDSAIIRTFLKKTLALTGLPIGQVHEAGDGEAALGLMRGNWIDLVVADLNMPVMDGVTMIENMRQDQLLRAIPVIVVSTEGSQPRLDRLRQLGVSVCVRKPFTPETFNSAIHTILEA